MASVWNVCRLGAVALSVGLAAASAGLAGAQGSAAPLLMSVDSPLDGAQIANGDTVFIGGWVVSQGGPNARVRIQAFLDGPPGSGVLLGNGVYGGPRHDVVAATGRAEWLNSAFGLTWRPRDLLAGDHVINVLAEMGGARLVNAVSVRVTSNPVTTRRTCSFMMPCIVDKTVDWYELDTGGPGIRIDYIDDSWPGR